MTVSLSSLAAVCLLGQCHQDQQFQNDNHNREGVLYSECAPANGQFGCDNSVPQCIGFIGKCFDLRDIFGNPPSPPLSARWRLSKGREFQ